MRRSTARRSAAPSSSRHSALLRSWSSALRANDSDQYSRCSLRPSGSITRSVAGGSFFTPFQDGARRRHHGVERQVVVERHRVERGVDAARGQQRRQARGEAQLARRLGVVQRLDAQPVARQDHAPAVALVQREGEHALQALRRARAPGVPGLEHHLGVAFGKEAVAQRLELAPQLAVVVDAAVEHQRQAEHRVAHRLRRALRQVDDLEPPVAERDAPARDHALAVRAAGGHRGVHALQRRNRGRRAVESDCTRYSTHNFNGLYYIFES